MAPRTGRFTQSGKGALLLSPMPNSSSAQVTFLFTDIAGSTRLWERDAAAMRAALERHNLILHAAIEQHGGEVFKTVGDQFCAAFREPTDAVLAAEAAQRALLKQVPEFRVRMAIHTGEAEAVEGDFLGPALNRVARLLTAGHGGQVLLSQATAEAVRGSLPAEMELQPLGTHQLRDLEASETIFQLQPAELPNRFPSLNTVTVQFRRGAVRAAKWAGIALTIMGVLAAAAVYQARRAGIVAESRRRDLYIASVNLAQQALEEGIQVRASQLLEQQRPGAGQSDLRHWEWRYLWRQSAPGWFLELPAQWDGCAVFSPNGKMLASTGRDLAVRVWRLERRDNPLRPVALRGEPLVLTGCTARVRMLAFSPDSRVLAAGGYEDVVRLWDTGTGIPLGPVFHLQEGYITGPGLDFSTGGILAARDGPYAIRLWDSKQQWKPLPVIRARGEYETNPALAFSPDGTQLAYTAGHTVQVRRLADEHETALRGPGLPANGVAFASDNRTVAAAAVGETIGLWDAVTGRRNGTPVTRQTDGFIPLAFFPHGRLLVSGGVDTTVSIWDTQASSEWARLLGNRATVTQVAVAPDGRTIASSSLDGFARLWSTALRPEADPVLPGGRGMVSVWHLAFSGDGLQLATGAHDGKARLWNLTRRAPPRVFEVDPSGKGITQVGISGDGSLLAAGRVALAGTTLPADARVWNTATGAEVFRPSINLRAYDMALSLDGRHLAISTIRDRIGAVELWDVRSGRLEGLLPGAAAGITALAFSPDGYTLAGGSTEGTVCLWDIRSRRRLAALLGHEFVIFCLAISHDGRTLASGSLDGTVRLWDVARRREQRPVQSYGPIPSSLSFSRDDRTLALANQTRRVRLYNVDSGQEVATLSAHGPRSELNIQSVAFSPDGNTLAVAQADWVRLWRAPSFADSDSPAARNAKP